MRKIVPEITEGTKPPVAPRRTQRERSEYTRSALLSAARSFFGRFGYNNTNADDVAKAASLTRGALYHHFSSKQDLFEALTIQLASELKIETVRSVQEALGAATELQMRSPTRDIASIAWEGILLSLKTYLELVSKDEELRQILLIDGPAVLGWETWRAIQFKVAIVDLASGLDTVMRAGVIRPS